MMKDGIEFVIFNIPTIQIQMKKKINTQTIGFVAVVLVVLLFTACNRGTGCPGVGMILPIF